MLPFYFGPDHRRLFGTYHPPSTPGPSPTALLLCNPFGQEAVRIHRIYRVLAERVSRMGVAVLRFDFFGTGDSAGSDTEGSLDGWISDIHAASRELTARAGPARLAWLGARLGATVAARATLSAEQPPEVLVLWEPVIDGPAYLRTLTEGVVAALDSSLSIRDASWHEMLAKGSPALAPEAIGFELVDPLRSQIRGLSAQAMTAPRALRCSVVHASHGDLTGSLIQRWRETGQPIDEVILEHEFDWLAEEALNTALVPSEVVQRLVAIVTERA